MQLQYKCSRARYVIGDAQPLLQEGYNDFQ